LYYESKELSNYGVRELGTTVSFFLVSVKFTNRSDFTREWCKMKNRLRFDFCIPEINLIIEIDGAQHFRQVSDWKSPELQFIDDKFRLQNRPLLRRKYLLEDQR
jgi:hypothetical protein